MLLGVEIMLSIVLVLASVFLPRHDESGDSLKALIIIFLK